MPHLFSPFTLRGLTLRNRIVMSPMAMYSAPETGIATGWHRVHYATRAVGGVGLIITEATAVEPRGRITVHDLGLWDDAQVGPLMEIAQLCQAAGAAIAVQLAHAGRKAFSPDRGVGPQRLVGPSPIAHDEGWVLPDELSAEGIAEVVEAFRAAARRADEAGLNAIEIHGAHGYLLHEFLSPLSNRRSDAYGGTPANRARLLLEVVDAVRALWPEEKPLIVRLSATDWVPETPQSADRSWGAPVPGGITIEDTVQTARWLKEHGVDMVDCSSGGILHSAPVNLGPGYQVPFAERVRREAGIPTIAVGLITAPDLAAEIVLNERADAVALGRELLRRPYWPLHAAHTLHVEIPWPEQYLRARSD